jgi:hypothetical protein
MEVTFPALEATPAAAERDSSRYSVSLGRDSSAEAGSSSGVQVGAFDAFAPAGWLQSHLIAYPKLTHAPVRHVVWTVSNLYAAAEANLSMIVHVFGGMAPQHSFVAV